MRPRQVGVLPFHEGVVMPARVPAAIAVFFFFFVLSAATRADAFADHAGKGLL